MISWAAHAAWAARTMVSHRRDGDRRAGVGCFRREGRHRRESRATGIDKDNIEVNLIDHTLTIKGEKKKEEEVKEENYYRCERSYGSFLRSVELPKDVHADKVKASFKNGILEVRMPKTEEAKSKEIKVKVE